MISKFRPSSLTVSLLLCSSLWLLESTATAQVSGEFRRVNLVSDIPGVALRSDPNLVTPGALRSQRPVRSGSPTMAPETRRSTKATAHPPQRRLRRSS